MAAISEVYVSKTQFEGRFDAEYYHPKYKVLDSVLNNLENKNKLGYLSNFIKKGIFDISPKKYRNFGVPLVRTTQIKTPISNENNLIYIDKEEHYKNQSKTELLNGDIVFTKIGAGIGDVGILNSNYSFYNFSQNVAGASIKRDKIDPYYLLSVLISKYGRDQILRYMMPSGQGKLELKDIKKVQIFRCEFEEEIGLIIKDAEHQIQLSQTLYQQATILLEKELGLDKITFEKTKNYTASFSEVTSTRRMNAEYFSPLVKEILSQPFLNNSKPIASFFQIIRGNSPKGYLTSGVPVIKTKNIRLPEIDRDRIADYVASTKDLTSIQESDLLLASMGVGSLGRMSFIQTLEQDYVVDGTIRVLRKKFETPDNFEIPTMLFLSTKIGQELIYRGIVGSTGIISLPDDYLYKIPIPQFDVELCYKLTQLVKDSITAKKESKSLLAQAKNRVEELIEAAATK